MGTSVGPYTAPQPLAGLRWPAAPHQKQELDALIQRALRS